MHLAQKTAVVVIEHIELAISGRRAGRAEAEGRDVDIPLGSYRETLRPCRSRGQHGEGQRRTRADRQCRVVATIVGKRRGRCQTDRKNQKTCNYCKILLHVPSKVVRQAKIAEQRASAKPAMTCVPEYF